jgi:hypothetical protein
MTVIDNAASVSADAMTVIDNAAPVIDNARRAQVRDAMERYRKRRKCGLWPGSTVLNLGSSTRAATGTARPAPTATTHLPPS